MQNKQNLFLDIAINKIDKKYIVSENKTNDYKTTHYKVSKENKKQIKKNIGDYFIIEYNYSKLYMKNKFLIKEIERIIKSFLKKYNKVEHVLIIGLGNELVLGDSLGVKATNKIIATNQYTDFLTIPKIALFNPSVTEKTGINSYKLIKMVVEDIKPNLIIIIDSLATKNENYLNNAIEINNTGIIPGSAINASNEINEKSFKIPILSIGIPCCLKLNNKFYTTTDIKDVIEIGSDIIAKSLNDIFINN